MECTLFKIIYHNGLTDFVIVVHPDKCCYDSEDSKKAFSKLRNAYEVITNSLSNPSAEQFAAFNGKQLSIFVSFTDFNSYYNIINVDSPSPAKIQNQSGRHLSSMTNQSRRHLSSMTGRVLKLVANEDKTKQASIDNKSDPQSDSVSTSIKRPKFVETILEFNVMPSSKLNVSSATGILDVIRDISPISRG
jgi:hypothetical protein